MNRIHYRSINLISAFFLRCIIMIVFSMSTCIGFSQADSLSNSPGYTVTKRLLSIEDGLASHEVFCGIQDGSGFMWFGTRNGLNRYDGRNCLLFTHQRNNLQDNKVVQLAKDNADNLFIEYGSAGFQLTTNGKVDVMNASTQRVTTLTAAFPKMPFKEKDVYWLSDDGTGNIHFLTAFPFRFWTYNSKKGFSLRLEMKEWDNAGTLPLADYRGTGPLCMFGKGKALLKLFNQATQYLVTENEVITFKQKDALRSLPIAFTNQNDLLVTYNTTTAPNAFAVAKVTGEGYVDSALDPVKNHLSNVKGKYWYQATNAPNSSSCVFYIGTDALYLWNENVFLKIVSKSELKNFENLFLYQLFADNLGSLWLCTSTGVLQLKVEKNRFEHYFTNEQQSDEKNSQARGIYADETGEVVANVWTHTFSQITNKLQYTSNEEIKYALVKHHSTLYCGGYNLFRFDPKKNKLLKYAGGEGSEIWSMFSFNDSLLLLGRSNGLSIFNSNTNTFDSIQYSNKNISEAKFVYRFLRNYTDTVWVVAENGLYKLARGRDGQLSIAQEQSSFINSLNLLDVYTEKNGIFWLATNGEGLYQWNRKDNFFRQFNITSGFPSDVLYRIEPDNYGNLWISSDYGLIRFNTKTFSVNTYTAIDGISHNEFNRTSSFKADNGKLFFGGIDGVNAFNPKDFVTDTNTLNAPLRIISFSQFIGSQNQLINKTAGLSDTAQIILAPNDKFFTIEFQLLDFAKDDVHRYAYQIEGLDKDWNYLNENSLRISGLPYGKFTLHIKAQTSAGAWSKSQLSVPISVLKPFYLQWWFIILGILFFIMLVYLLIHLRIKQLAADKKKLEETVSERTAQLKKSISEQSALLLEKDLLMKEIHHRVKNNLQVISGLLELQSNNLNDEKAKEALREGRSRVKSIALIHQNLYQFKDISTIEVGTFVKDLSRQVEQVFDSKQNVQIKIEVPLLYLDIDSAVPLGLIINELLSNSFKYAFYSVSECEINIKINNVAKGKYQLLYSDNGPGLPDDFDLGKATTLGLQLINDLARQIAGKVKYENRNGSAFIITFTDRDFRKRED